MVKGIKFKASDIVIVLLAAVLIVAAWWYMGYRGRNSQTTKATVSIELANVSEDVAKGFIAGNRIDESIKSKHIGVISEVKDISLRTEIAENNLDGKFLEAKIPDEYKATVVIDADVKVTDSSIAANGIVLKVGKTLYVKTKGCGAASVITGIDLK